jgi:hypothetical protein
MVSCSWRTQEKENLCDFVRFKSKYQIGIDFVLKNTWILAEILSWSGFRNIRKMQWANKDSMQECWTKMVLDIGKERKAMASMIILVSWEI